MKTMNGKQQFVAQLRVCLHVIEICAAIAVLGYLFGLWNPFLAALCILGIGTTIYLSWRCIPLMWKDLTTSEYREIDAGMYWAAALLCLCMTGVAVVVAGICTLGLVASLHL